MKAMLKKQIIAVLLCGSVLLGGYKAAFSSYENTFERNKEVPVAKLPGKPDLGEKSAKARKERITPDHEISL